MRLLVIADCVPTAQAQAVAPGVVTERVDGFTEALDIIRQRRADVVIAPESVGERQTGSCLDVARVARAAGVACVVITTVWEDGAYGAAVMAPGSDVRDAVRRAVSLRR
jgi:hypothetical protein